MQFLVIFTLLAWGSVALRSPHRPLKSQLRATNPWLSLPVAATAKRDDSASRYLNANTTKFLVNGTGLPDVDFDIGESYAGQIPIGGDSDGELFFWFFPTTAPGDDPEEIIIWLNGGPGCSSLDGFFKENGPVLWGTGTPYPVENPWSWHHLTNVIWVEYPVGTGFSTGTVTATSEEDIVEDFKSFWRNFVDAFGIQGYKVYIAGESYAGTYCPYLASGFVDANDTDYYNVKGMQIYDPLFAEWSLLQEIPIYYFVDYWKNIFTFNSTTLAVIRNMSEACGFNEYIDHYLSFPPKGQQPILPPGYLPDGSDYDWDSCDIFDVAGNAFAEINPNFNVYQVTALGPLAWDVLGFAGSNPYTWPGTNTYFNRTDVKEAIHAPVDVEWSICADHSVFVNGSDTSEPPLLHALPNVIDHTNNVQIVHGTQDYVLVANGSLLAIQNMTWGGQLGFQYPPASPFFVPHHPNPDPRTASGQGVLGSTHTERGLTWTEVVLTGHMVPEWQAAASFRLVEFLLGRVDSLQSTKPLSNYPDAPQPAADSIGEPVGPLVGVGSGGGKCKRGNGA